MSEIGDTFAGFADASMARRAHNRASTPEVLADHGVKFTAHNNGAHLVVEYNSKTADLWPGTGKYLVRGAKQYRRGVFNLMRDLGVDRTIEPCPACGFEFDIEATGKYGCPNCHGEGLT